MLDQCPNCDAMIASARKECKCGFEFKRERNLLKIPKFCQYSVEICREEARFPVCQPDGTQMKFCLVHYDMVRPKSDLDLQCEAFIKKHANDVKKSLENGNFKEWVSSLLCRHQ